MLLTWKHQGPPRDSSIEVPPLPSLIDWYALGFDEQAGQLFYLCIVDDEEGGGECQRFDGAAWRTQGPRFKLPFQHVEGGAFDSSRRAIVAWGFGWNHQTRTRHAAGALVTDAGATPLATRGDAPIVEPEGEGARIGTFDKRGLFAFDRAREVWVCLTRRGLWELDASGAWSRKSGFDAALIPQEWHDKTGDGVFDPLGRRCVFMVQSKEVGYGMILLAWDGARLSRLGMTGLPALTFGFEDASAQIAGHPHHGLVLHASAGRLFRATDGAWERLPDAESPPPLMQSALLACDPARDLLLLGPGAHEGAGGSDRNRVFFALRGGRWEKQGEARRYSALKGASYGNCQVAHAGGSWFALGTHSLRTWRWSGAGWDELVDKEAGEKASGWTQLQIVAAGERLYAVTVDGAVFALDGKKWTQLAKKAPAFKSRTGFALAADPAGRLLVWGGEAKGRKLNDTLFFEGKSWRAAKKPSPQPADFKHGQKDGVYVGTQALFDTALGAFVRFGFEELAVLQADETWRPLALKGYKANIGPRGWAHAPLHDPQSGETLIVDFSGGEKPGSEAEFPGRILRFDLAGCATVATIETPPELARKGKRDAPPYRWLTDAFSWDAATRSLHAQVLEDEAGVYRLDLAEAFEAAKALGPRKLPDAAPAKPAAGPPPVRLFKLSAGGAELFAVEPGAKPLVARTLSGEVGAKLIAEELSLADAEKRAAAKRKAGFLPGDKLPREALAALVGVESCALAVGKVVRGALPASHLGGLPSGVSGKSWPRYRGSPMGFLFQLETGALIPGIAALAVFCAHDGEPTVNREENAVVLLTAKELAKSGAAPEGVPLLAARALELKAPKLEIDEERAQRLGAGAPELGAAIERLAAGKGMQADNLSSKRGGLPQFLQSAEAMKGHRFVAQLDFDSIATREWPEAGLAGCVYLFVRNDGEKAVAFWQYT